jgi:hypothetical protein
MSALRLGLDEGEERGLYSARSGNWEGYPRADGGDGVHGWFGPSDEWWDLRVSVRDVAGGGVGWF